MALGAVLQITGIRPVVTNLTILTNQLSVGGYAVGQRRVLLGPIAGEHLTPGGVALTTITMVPASRTACGHAAGHHPDRARRARPGHRAVRRRRPAPAGAPAPRPPQPAPDAFCTVDELRTSLTRDVPA